MTEELLCEGSELCFEEVRAEKYFRELRERQERQQRAAVRTPPGHGRFGASDAAETTTEVLEFSSLTAVEQAAREHEQEFLNINRMLEAYGGLSSQPWSQRVSAVEQQGAPLRTDPEPGPGPGPGPVAADAQRSLQTAPGYQGTNELLTCWLFGHFNGLFVICSCLWWKQPPV